MRPFLSSNAQDFIEEVTSRSSYASAAAFLSSNAQDFIEEQTLDFLGALGTDS